MKKKKKISYVGPLWGRNSLFFYSSAFAYNTEIKTDHFQLQTPTHGSGCSKGGAMPWPQLRWSPH